MADAPECSGFLKKAGGSMMKRDQDRWFELRSKMLYYYKARPASKSDEPLGKIDLRDTTLTEDPKKRLAWTIQGPKMHKAYTLYASNEQEKRLWIAKIKESKPDGSSSDIPVKGGDSDDEEDVFHAQQVGLEDFDLLTVVGKGSFGKVMQVRKKDSKEIYAMKCMSKELILREGLVEHMKAEKNILGAINHPYIVKLHFAFQTKESLFLILDFLSGGELFYHLSQVGTFPESRAKFYTAQIGLSLGHLHSLNIIYRDLKPENCVLDRKGNCCITDFGLAKPGINGKEEATTFCGTPEYLAPEFLDPSRCHGKAVDWWSLGILLYEMICGLPPFYSENLNEMYELIKAKPLQFPDGMSATSRALCSRLLDRSKDRRLQDVETFKKQQFFNGFDFDALLAGQLAVPFVPEKRKLNFDDEFTAMPAKCSFHVSPRADKGEFDCFHYDRRVMVKNAERRQLLR